MKFEIFLSVCSIFAMILSIAQAQNRKRTRHFLSRTWPYTDGSFESDYSEIYDHEDWGRNQDYEEKMSDMDGYESHGSSATFRPYIPDKDWNNIPSKEYQRESNFIPLGDTRMSPDSIRNHPNIVCHCETNFKGIQVLPSNEIQFGEYSPYRRPHDPKDSGYGHPQTYESGFRSLPYPLRTRPLEMNPKENHYNHVNFRRPISEEIQASKMNKLPIRPELTTANPMLLRTTTEAQTRGGSQPSAVIRVLT